MVKYYHQFVDLKALSVVNIQQMSGKVVEATVHLDFTTGVRDLTLVHPARPMQPIGHGISMEWYELQEKLSAEKVAVVKVLLDPPDLPAPNEGLPWKVEIWGPEIAISIIHCKDIEGLPEHSE